VASDKTTVAVVITTYNHAHFLQEAIQSVLEQTHPAEEIVVVDDGSSDDPAAVLAPHPQLRLLRQSNQGLAAARNAGLRALRSDKVIFLDADDRLLPDAIAAGLACFAAAPASAFVYGAYRTVDAQWQPLSPLTHHAVGAEPWRDLLRGNLIGMHATVMYDRARLVAGGAFDPTVRRCEDYDAYLRLARDGAVASHAQLVAEYRRHDANMSLQAGEMLDWALRVHARHRAAAKAQGAAAFADWRQGRRAWRRYYAGEIWRAAGRCWAVDRAPLAATRGALQAMSASPGVVLQRLRNRLALGRLLGRRHAAPGRRHALGAVRLGDLDAVTPVSDDFGFDRGTPIDRLYIEQFLQAHAADIAGHALEVGDDAYCRRFGAERITRQHVLDVSADNPAATLVGDLSQPHTLPAAAFDVLVITQTLHLVFDMAGAVAELHRALRPGGVLLLTVPGISRVDRGQWDTGWYWSLTAAAATRLFGAAFGAGNVQVQSHGNVYAATTFLQGLAVEEADRAKLAVHDPCFPVIVAVRARKP
jgi:SAM-dependent methyltransferase